MRLFKRILLLCQLWAMAIFFNCRESELNPDIYFNTLETPVYLSVNEVTIKASDAAVVGQTYLLNNVSYVVVDSVMLYSMVKNYVDSIIPVTTFITNMNQLFIREERLLANEFPIMDISSWDVSNVTDMSFMFSGIGLNSFVGDINDWNVSGVANMSFMFDDNEKFNQDISNWNVQNVTNMQRMFSQANAFNQDISKWNVSKVINMESMFKRATSFNQNLNPWEVGNVIECNNFSLHADKWIGKKPIFINCSE